MMSGHSTSENKVGIVGLGLLGRGIATCLLAYGFDVVAYGRTEQERQFAYNHIAEALSQMALREQTPSPFLSDWQTRYHPTDNLDDFAPCSFVIESIIEDLDAKTIIFDHLERVLGHEVPIASNTSALPISILQKKRQNPSRFVGMHWGEPAHILRFSEIIRGELTSDKAFDAAAKLATQLGKEPSLVQKDVRGFITNRLMYAMLREAFHLLETGVADAETIDRSFRNDIGWWSTIAGPFRFLDLTGIGAYASVMRELLPELSDQKTVPKALQDMIDQGAKGVSNCQGFYEYTPEQAQAWVEKWQAFTWDIHDLADKYIPTRPIAEGP